ncbi:hypothetical protein [Coleofasciculus sp. H7-2]
MQYSWEITDSSVAHSSIAALVCRHLTKIAFSEEVGLMLRNSTYRLAIAS